MGQIELFNQGVLLLVMWNYTAVCKLFLFDKNTSWTELLMLYTWDHLTVSKEMIDNKKNYLC